MASQYLLTIYPARNIALMMGCTLGEALQNIDEPGRMGHEANEWQATGQDCGSPERILCMVRGRLRLFPTFKGV